jgi:hypothetical protein
VNVIVLTTLTYKIGRFLFGNIQSLKLTAEARVRIEISGLKKGLRNVDDTLRVFQLHAGPLGINIPKGGNHDNTINEAVAGNWHPG